MIINVSQYANFIWDVADILRGDYKQSDYGKVILPMTVLRRLDCDLASTKDKVLARCAVLEEQELEDLEVLLNNVAKKKFHNRSQYDFDKLIADPENIAPNLRNFINGFSKDARDIIDQFDFDKQITHLNKANLLYQVVKKFQEIDFHPKPVTNLEMGYIFEELIRKFAEYSNETAGEHFTPREVIRLMVNLLFINDRDVLAKEAIIRTIYDPACGTGGMLSVAEDYLLELNPASHLETFGQEVNPESYAICKSDMMVTGHNVEHIQFGDTLRFDKFKGKRYDYMLSNPPFGVKWNKSKKEVKREYEEEGYAGRFGAGLPSISDGSFLFLQTMLAKMQPANGGSRLAIVFNGSPLFTGNAGSGPSNIRKWIIENDFLEAIIALPDQLFYNTGISTYIWVITNRKSPDRKDKIQLINAVSFYHKMAKSLGKKRNEISDEDIQTIVTLYGDIKENKYSKIFDNEDFGYRQITIERPLRDKKGEILLDKKGNPKPDTSLRDRENIPLRKNIHTYFEREVKPHLPHAWIDENKTRIGYEINFTKYFYEFKPLRSLEAITQDLLDLEAKSDGLLKEIWK